MVRVAAATYPAGAPESWSAWEDAVESWVADARADLLVFPEYGAMELARVTRAEGLSDQMAAVSDALPRAWDHWATLAQRYGAHILAPSGPVREPQGFVNRAMFFAPNGERQAHDKQVMTPWERDPMDMRRGAAPVLMETSLGRIGVQICYDAEFPLATRAMAEAGLDILLVPSQTETLAGFHRVRIGAQARALEAQCFAVQSPTQGVSDWSVVLDENAGTAGLYAPPDLGFPDDGVVAQGVMNQPGWTRATLDLAHLRRIRECGGVQGRAHWPEQFGGDSVALPRISVVDMR